MDFHGNMGFLITPTVGFGLPTASAGGIFTITSADTIFDLKGFSFEAGVSTIVGGLEVVLGNGYVGCNISYGPSVAPFEAHAELTYSFLISIGSVKSIKDNIIKTFKGIYDDLSDEQKEGLYVNFGITAESF